MMQKCPSAHLLHSDFQILSCSPGRELFSHCLVCVSRLFLPLLLDTACHSLQSIRSSWARGCVPLPAVSRWLRKPSAASCPALSSPCSSLLGGGSPLLRRGHLPARRPCSVCCEGKGCCQYAWAPQPAGQDGKHDPMSWMHTVGACSGNIS